MPAFTQHKSDENKNSYVFLNIPPHLSSFFSNCHQLIKNWVVVSNVFYFHPYLGKIPILTNIFQLGWIHQPEKSSRAFSPYTIFDIFCQRLDVPLARYESYKYATTVGEAGQNRQCDTVDIHLSTPQFGWLKHDLMILDVCSPYINWRRMLTSNSTLFCCILVSGLAAGVLQGRFETRLWSWVVFSGLSLPLDLDLKDFKSATSWHDTFLCFRQFFIFLYFDLFWVFVSNISLEWHMCPDSSSAPRYLHLEELEKRPGRPASASLAAEEPQDDPIEDSPGTGSWRVWV